MNFVGALRGRLRPDLVSRSQREHAWLGLIWSIASSFNLIHKHVIHFLLIFQTDPCVPDSSPSLEHYEEVSASDELESSHEMYYDLDSSRESNPSTSLHQPVSDLSSPEASNLTQCVEEHAQSTEVSAQGQRLYDMAVYETELATKPLYDGARVTLLEALVEQFLWFAEHSGISKEALSDMLHFQHHRILPSGNLLPDSYEAALKLIEPFLVAPVIFHACPN